jgi:hypothetical protein
MNKEFIPYEQALELQNLGYKELGFDEECLGYYARDKHLRIQLKYQIYNFHCYAPLYQQAFRWFREKYNLICSVEYMGKNKINWWDIHIVGHYNIHYEEMCMKYQSYEEAELACLKKLIEIVKNK